MPEILPPENDLVPLIQAIDAAPVLCVGDAMLDRFVYGSVDRISPEAPIPVLRVKGESVMPGAAGNVAANLVALGASVRLASVVGDDGPGRALEKHLQTLTGTVPLLIVEPGRETTVKTRYVAAAQQLLRADRESLVPISATTIERLNQGIAGALNDCRAVILSDYGKGVLTQHVIDQTIAAARNAGCPVIVDPKGDDYTRYRGATVVTPNRKELARGDWTGDGNRRRGR